MEPASAADNIVLVAGPGPEALSAVLVLGVAICGAAAGVMMAQRGRIEAWSLVGLFGLVILGAMLTLAHVPTRLVLDRDGAELGFWGLNDRRGWNEVAAVSVTPGRLGAWLSFTIRSSDPSMLSVWSRWPGVFVPDPALEPRQIAMRVEAWRLAAGR